MKKAIAIIVLGFGLVLGVNANAAEKSNTTFCVLSDGLPVMHNPATSFSSLKAKCPYRSKIISMREYVDMTISMYLNSPAYNHYKDLEFINLLRAFKGRFTSANFDTADTAYLDSEIIKNFSNKLNKNEILTILNIVKEPTEKQIMASLNMTKEEYEQKKKEQEIQRLKDEELKIKREEVQRLAEAEELKLKDPLYRANSELSISIKEATQETDIIKINEAYSLKCEAEIEDLRFIFNQKVFKSKILKSEVIMIFEGEKIYFKIDSKINSKGKLSKSTVKVHYAPDFDKDIKNSIKPYINMFKQVAKEGFTDFSIYGKTLLPIQIEDKKKSKQMLSLAKKIICPLLGFAGGHVPLLQSTGLTALESYGFFTLSFISRKIL